MKIAYHYCDLSEDVILLGAICYSVSVTHLDAKSFTMQLIIAYVLSISIPLLINSTHIILYNLEVVDGNISQSFSLTRKVVFVTLMLFFSPFIPGIVIYQIAKKQQLIYKIFETMSKNVNIKRKVTDEADTLVGTSIKLRETKIRDSANKFYEDGAFGSDDTNGNHTLLIQHELQISISKL